MWKRWTWWCIYEQNRLVSGKGETANSDYWEVSRLDYIRRCMAIRKILTKAGSATRLLSAAQKYASTVSDSDTPNEIRVPPKGSGISLGGGSMTVTLSNSVRLPQAAKAASANSSSSLKDWVWDDYLFRSMKRGSVPARYFNFTYIDMFVNLASTVMLTLVSLTSSPFT